MFILGNNSSSYAKKSLHFLITEMWIEFIVIVPTQIIFLQSSMSIHIPSRNFFRLQKPNVSKEGTRTSNSDARGKTLHAILS